MGIKNLKYLFKGVNSEAPTNFRSLVVDGNNLVITFLCSAKEKVKKEYSLLDWQGFSIDVIQQTKYILLETYKMILTELSRFVKRYGIEEIWITFDPSKNMRYNILLDKFNLVDPDAFDKEVGTDNTISLNLKEEEQKRREQTRNLAKDKMHTIMSSIENSDFYKELGDIDFIKALFKQSYGYNDTTMLHKLLKMVQKALTSKSRFSLNMQFKDEEPDYINKNTQIDIPAKIYIVKAIDEADLVIKNVCEIIENINDCNILVMSKDTDYKVLFADKPSVYLTDLHCDFTGHLFHPYSAWRKVLPSSIENIYDYAIRLAPILGNDYTLGHGIITLTDTANCKNLINSLLTFDKKNLNKNTSLYKFLKTYDELDDLISPRELDNRIKNVYSGTNYYMKYLQSVVIYTNYKFFNKFEISTKKFEFDRNLDFVFKNILTPAYGELFTFTADNNIKNLISAAGKLDEFKESFYKNIAIDDEYFD